MSDTFWIVAGGQNLDLIATARKPFHLSDSTPGVVVERAGGVALNIARNLVMLTRPVYFLSVRGEDSVGRLLDEVCRASNLVLDHVLVRSDLASSRYIAINDEIGDMVAAINDMTAIESLTLKDIKSWRSLGSRAHREQRSVVDDDERFSWRSSGSRAFRDPDCPEMLPCAAVIDANLPEQVIVYLASEWDVPIFADAVSIAKVDRLKPVFHRLAGLKLNRMEARYLTNLSITTLEDAVKAAHRLIAEGIGSICLSLGAEGALFADGRQTVVSGYDFAVERQLDGCTEETTGIVNTTGAGDAMAAIFAWAMMSGYKLEGAARLAQAAASLTLESTGAVNDAMTKERLERRADSARLTLQVL